MSLQILNDSIEKIKKQKAFARDDATKIFDEKLEILKREKVKLVRIAQQVSEKDFREIATIIGECSRISFLISVLGGYDNEFQVTHYVQWLEIRIENSIKHSRDFIRYADKENSDVLKPNLENVKGLHTQIKNQYERYVEGENNEI